MEAQGNVQNEKSFIKPPECNEPGPANQEDELNALLDEALEDFDKPQPLIENTNKTSSNSDESSTINPASIHAPGNNPNNDPLFEALWNDNTFNQMTDGFNDVLEQMSKEDPTMMAEFEKFQETLTNPSSEIETSEPKTIDENFSKTLTELTKNMQGLNTSDGNIGFEDMLKKMQDEMGNAFGEGVTPDQDSFMSMMQGMMQNLLTKDLLYPSLKEIKDKYPSWLEKNESELSKEDFEKYESQEKIVTRLCVLFEQEKDNDSDSVKAERMDKIMELMQKMQEYGHPPVDMIADMSSEVDQATPPPLPECSIM